MHIQKRGGASLCPRKSFFLCIKRPPYLSLNNPDYFRGHETVLIGSLIIIFIDQSAVMDSPAGQG